MLLHKISDLPYHRLVIGRRFSKETLRDFSITLPSAPPSRLCARGFVFLAKMKAAYMQPAHLSCHDYGLLYDCTDL